MAIAAQGERSRVWRIAAALVVVLATGAAKPQGASPTAAPAAGPMVPTRLAAVLRLHDQPLQLELVQDARIAHTTQPELERAHWFGMAGNRRLEQLLAKRPLADAVLRLVSADGRVVLRAGLDTPFATLQRLPPQLGGTDVFLLVSEQGGVGQDVLAVGQLLTVEPGRLRAVGAIDDDGRMEVIRLMRGGKTDWRILAGDDAGGAILQVQCIVDTSVAEGFRQVLSVYHAGAQGWRLRRHETAGWCDWPGDFPPVTAFP